jgi:hypothetical protein
MTDKFAALDTKPDKFAALDTEPDKFAALDTEPDKGDGGFLASAKNVGGGILAGAGHVLSDVGADTIGEYAKEQGKQIREDNPLAVQKLSDIPEHTGKWVSESVGGMAAQAGAAAIGGAAGTALGALTGPLAPVAMPALGYVGANLPMWIQEYGGEREQQKENGIDDMGRAASGATVNTAIENLGGFKPGGFGAPRNLIKAATNELAGKTFKEGAQIVGKKMLKSGAEEALEEIPQEYVGAYGGGTDFKDLNTMENLESAAFGAASAFPGGALFGGSGIAKNALLQKKEPEPAEVPPQTVGVAPEAQVPAPEAQAPVPGVANTATEEEGNVADYTSADLTNTATEVSKPFDEERAKGFVKHWDNKGVPTKWDASFESWMNKFGVNTQDKSPADAFAELKAIVYAQPKARVEAVTADLTETLDAHIAANPMGSTVSKAVKAAVVAGTTEPQITAAKERPIIRNDGTPYTTAGEANNFLSRMLGGKPSSEHTTVKLPEGGFGIIHNNQIDDYELPDAKNTETTTPTKPTTSGTSATAPGSVTADDQSQDPATQESAAEEAPIDEAIAREHPLSEANNYQVAGKPEDTKKAAVNFQDLHIAIENPVGSVRSGTSPEGEKWETTMQDHYGEIKAGEGADGDAVDTFIPAGLTRAQIDSTQNAYVIDQVDPKTGLFDEVKVILGVSRPEEAKAVYARNYAPDWKGFGAITAMPMVDFKTWVHSAAAKLPAAKTEARKQEENQGVRREDSTVGDNPSLAPSGEGQAATTGLEETLVTPKNDRQVSVRYAFIPESEITTSHDANLNINPAYPAELQPRMRTATTYAVDLQNKVANFNPNLVGESHTTDTGAPIVTHDGVVISGNGRTLAIKKSRVEYDAWLKANAVRFGLHPALLKGMEKPVLVRVLRENEEGLEDLARKSNDHASKEMGVLEQAFADSRSLSPEILSLYKGGNAYSTSNAGFVRNFVTATGADNIFDQRTGLSPKGIDRIEAAIMAATYGDKTIVGDMFEKAENPYRSILNGMLKAAPDWLEMHSPRSTDALVGAALMVKQARNTPGMSVKALAAQEDMFSSQEEALAKLFMKQFFHDPELTRYVGADGVGEKLKSFAKAMSSPSIFGDEVTPEGLLSGGPMFSTGTQQGELSIEEAVGEEQAVKPRAPSTTRQDQPTDSIDKATETEANIPTLFWGEVDIEIKIDGVETKIPANEALEEARKLIDATEGFIKCMGG